jgi:hypothetical protein
MPLGSSFNFAHYEEGCTYSAVVTATVLLTRIPDFLSGRTRCIKSAFSAWVAISQKHPRLLCSLLLLHFVMVICFEASTCQRAVEEQPMQLRDRSGKFHRSCHRTWCTMEFPGQAPISRLGCGRQPGSNHKSHL